LSFAGQHVDGLPLVAILRRKGTADYVSFVYGDCMPATSDEGCASPAEVQVGPRTSRPPDRYEVRVPAGPEPQPERTSVQGVPASLLDGRLRLELFTPRSTIVVFGDSPERVRAVADALRCLPDRGRGPPRSLLDC
jgi:hypothetical protein